MSAVDTALLEIVQAMADMQSAHEGFRDLFRVNITETTRGIIEKTINVFDERLALLKKCKAALEQLVGDGYPALDVEQIPAEEFADMADQLTTITAALAHYSILASSLTFTAGAPEEKSNG